MKKELFVEQFNSVQAIDLQESAGGKKWIISGRFTKVDTPNGNNRVYPRNEMQQAIEKCRKKVKEGKVKMQLDHPDCFEGSKLGNTAAILMDLTDVDGEGYAHYKAQICDTTKGKDVKAIIDAGGVVGVSTRGYGYPVFDQEIPGCEGKFTVIKDYQLESIDFVDEPSCKDTETGVTVESQQRSDKMPKTLEELMKEHPEVFAGFTKTFEDEKAKMIADANALRESIKKITDDFAAVVTSIKQVQPDAFTVIPESDTLKAKDAEIVSLKESLASMTKELETFKTTVATLEGEKVKIAKEKQIESLRATDPAYFANEALVKRFESCNTADEIVKVYESNKEVFASFMKSGSGTPTPDAPKTKVEPQGKTLTEAQEKDFKARNHERMSGGLAQMSKEDYIKNYVK